MKRCDNPDSIDVEKSATKLGDRCGSLENILRRKCAEATDDLGANCGKLTLEERIAGEHFVRLGIPIVRWPALEHIADVNIIALDVDRFDDLREELARAADEGQALLVFIKSRRFTDENKLGAGLPEPKTIFVRVGASLHLWQSPMSDRMRASSSTGCCGLLFLGRLNVSTPISRKNSSCRAISSRDIAWFSTEQI
jgi:hypothetical protein